MRKKRKEERKYTAVLRFALLLMINTSINIYERFLGRHKDEELIGFQGCYWTLMMLTGRMRSERNGKMNKNGEQINRKSGEEERRKREGVAD